MQQSASKKADSTPIVSTETPVVSFSPSVSTAATKPEEQDFVFIPKSGKALHQRLEGLRILNQKKALYDDFAARLENVKTYKEENQQSSLLLTITNGKKKLDFASQSLIQFFLEEAVKEGQRYKENAEIEMLSIEL